MGPNQIKTLKIIESMFLPSSYSSLIYVSTLVLCTDEDQKSETIVCGWKYENDNKLTWNS